ncbi:insulin receptor substrate 2-A-like isoform X2 [Etheostoma cragini]|uniref:insulin receptor substrate 2-A-like isoform X2 n=1 Tax=Etheostoma cragini TaxID=417921 RepID=UPI00155E34E0|nr:insulin receptor substrate 2-A-like isoform X2 [Etheostoma cragini]
MNENAEGHSRCADQARSLPASTSPLSSSSCSSTQTWLPSDWPLEPSWTHDRQQDQDQDQGSRHHYAETESSPASRFYEELFCRSQGSNTLAGTLMTSSPPQSDVVKQSSLGKLERNHTKYFVLRAGSHTGPSRLEWYKSQKKFTAMEKSAGKAALYGSTKVIYLRCCLGVSRSSSSRKGHTVVLYAKDQTMVLVVEDQWEQAEWYLAIKKLMEEEQKDEEHGEGFDEEDDGYCTLPPVASFKEVWPVTVKPRGLGSSKSLLGESRLCLTATSLILVRVAACSDLASVTIPLLSVRRFGHLDGSFFLELGRSAQNGPGEIWMEAREQGNPAIAQHIHEVVRETVRALRALPDFSRSPTSNHNQLQNLQASKRCRIKYRDKQVNVRPLASRLALPPRNPEIQTTPTKCCLEPREQHKTEPESDLSPTSHLSPFSLHQSSMSETGSYMEMKTDHHLPVDEGRDNDCRTAVVTGDQCGVAASGMEGWEPGEEQGPGYMMMSPQGSRGRSVLPQDDYVTMASPLKHSWLASSSLSSSPQTSFNSSTSDSCSPLHPSHHQTNEHSGPHWLVTSVQQSETEAGQSQKSISCSTQPQDGARQERTSAKQRRLPAPTWATSSPVRSVGGSGVLTPFAASGSGYTRSIQANPNSGAGRSSQLQAASRQIVRYRLSLCLPCCLQAEDRH